MIAQTIKSLLGEELAGQVEAALAGKGSKGTDVDLVAGNDGSFVPAETHEQLQTQMTRLQKTTALKLGLGGNVHDPEDIIARLDLERLELDEQGNLKTPLEELIQPIRESKPYLFKELALQGASLQTASPAAASPAAAPSPASASQTPPLNLQGAVPGQVGTQSGDVNAQQLNDAFGLKGE